MTKPQKPAGPLNEDEIGSALQHSGFPLEIRLLQAFHDAGFDPSIGMRFIPGVGEKSAEVDVIARCTAPLAEHRGFVRLWALIEAKQLGERVAFVGLKWKQPDAHSMRAMRIRFSGVPTCQVLWDGPNGQDLVQLLLGGSDPVAKALDPLNAPPVCPHWTYVRENTKHKDENGRLQIEAKKEDDARESFAKLVRVTTWLERDHANYLTSHPGKPSLLCLQILSPTIVLGTPHLYLYDPLMKTIEKTNSLILQEMYEAGGEVHGRYVDVVTESALPEFIERYRRTVAELQASFDRHLYELTEIAAAQHEVQDGATSRRSS